MLSSSSSSSSSTCTRTNYLDGTPIFKRPSRKVYLEAKRRREKEEEMFMIRQQAAARFLQAKPRTPQQLERLNQPSAVREKRQYQGLAAPKEEAITSTTISYGAHYNPSVDDEEYDDESCTFLLTGSPGSSLASPSPCFRTRPFATALGPVMPMHMAPMGLERKLYATTRPRTKNKNKVQPQKKEAHYSNWYLQKMTENMQHHNHPVRCIVMTLLLGIFFLLLNPELDVALGGGRLLTVTDRHSREALGTIRLDYIGWWAEIASELFQDLGCLMHMFLCALVHFAICDVAMIYTFDALKIGSISGHDIRNFVTKTMRSKLWLVSVGVLAVSLIKAWARDLQRGVMSLAIPTRQMHAIDGSMVWSLRFQTPNVSFCNDLLLGQPNATNEIIQQVARYTDFAEDVADKWICFNMRLLGFVAAPFLHGLGLLLVVVSPLVHGATEKVRYTLDMANSWCATWVHVLPPTTTGPILSWRSDAFETARLMYSYSAVFLVVLMLLFHIWASFERKRVAATVTTRKENWVE